MANYEAQYQQWKKNRAAETAARNTSEKQQSSDYEARYQQWKRKRDGESGATQENLSQRMNDWISQSGDYINKYNTTIASQKGTYEDDYFDGADNFYRRMEIQNHELGAAADALLKDIADNEEYLDAEWVSQVREALTGDRKTMADALENTRLNRDYWQGFGGAEGYRGSAEGYRQWKQRAKMESGHGSTFYDMARPAKESSPVTENAMHLMGLENAWASGVGLPYTQNELFQIRRSIEDQERETAQMEEDLAQYQDLVRLNLDEEGERRQKELYDQYGYSYELEDEVERRREQLSQRQEALAAMEANERYNGYRSKYGGMNYTQLTSAAEALPEGEEKQWLSQYATSVMEPEDYEKALTDSRAALESLKAEQDAYIWDTEVDFTDNQARQAYDAKIAEYDDQIKALNEQIWELEKRQKYSFLNRRADYETASQYAGPTDGGVKAWMANTLNPDDAYVYINRPEERGSWKYMGNAATKGYEYMTQEEIANYNYLYNTEGKEAADEYLEYLENTLGNRMSMDTREYFQDFAEDHEILSSIASVPLNLISGIGLVDIGLQNLDRAISGEYKPINYNSFYMQPSIASSTIRGTVAQSIADKTGVIQLDEKDHPYLSRIFNGKGLGDVYQLGMSMVDSAAIAALSPVIGSAGTVLLGGSAGTQGVLDALEAGASDGQALTMGILNGVFEMLFEKVSLENLLKGDGKNIIKSVVQQAFVEGSEEFNTTLANTIADTLVMAEKSGIHTAIQQYMDENPGMSKTTATIKAVEDVCIQMGWDFFGGAVMGGVMGAAAAPIQNYQYRTAEGNRLFGADPEGLVAEALDIDPANTLAQSMQNRLDRGKSVSGSQLYALYQQNEGAIQQMDVETIRTAAEQRLQELGETGDVAAVADAIAKKAAGKTISTEERNTIALSLYGERVANELSAGNIRSGDYSAAWTGKIGTQRINAEEYNRFARQAGQNADPVMALAEEMSGVASTGTAEETTPISIQDAAEKYGDQSGAMLHTYQVGQNVEKYDAAYGVAYVMGKTGASLTDTMKNAGTAYLTDKQKELAWEAGKASASGEYKYRKNIVAGSRTGGYNNSRTAQTTLEQEASIYGSRAADMVRTYREGQNVEDFAKGYGIAYTMGQQGVSADYARRSDAAKFLTTEQIDAAYRAGQAASEYTVNEEDTNGTGEAIRLRRGIQRNDGTGTSGQVRGVGEAAGSLQEGAEESRSESGGGNSQQAQRKVSAGELGILGGTGERSLRIYQGEETDSIRQAKAEAEKAGKDLVLLSGDSIRVALPNGKVIAVRALIQGDTIYARADHGKFDALQLVRHELTHPKVDRGEINVRQVYGRMVELATEENMKWLVEQYAMAYGMEYEGEEAAMLVFTEIVCDSQADMNAFAENVREDAAPFLREIKKLSQQSAKTTDSTGPPVGAGQNFSRAQKGRSIELETMENNRFERLRQFHDTLPAEWYAFTGKNFYIYSNQSFTDYTILVTARITSKNKGAIENFVEALENGTYEYSKTLDSWTSHFRRGKGRYSWDSVHSGNRGTAVQTDGVDVGKRGSKNTGNSAESGGAGKVKQSFSMERVVEETKNLVAVHNLSEEKLVKSLKLGGLPMPSIAIVKAQDGHGEFGDISLVFGKDTIDPNAYRANKIYSGDAWTPTYPTVEYKPSEKVLNAVKKKVSELVPYDMQRGLGDSLMLDPDNARNDLNRNGGNLAEAYKTNDSMKYAFLKDTGVEFELPMKESDLYYYGGISNDAVMYFSGKLVNGLQTVEHYQNMGAREMMKDTSLAEAVADAMNWDVLRTMEPGSQEYQAYEKDPVFKAEEIGFSDMNKMLIAARKLLTNGTQQTVDRKAARETINGLVDQTAYENWLNELFSGVVEKEGIRNDKDLFTPSGNRRSFEALHYEHNLENVIRAMREKGDKGIGGFGGGNIFGAAATEFSSVEEMKRSNDRLQKLTEEEYEAIKKGFSDRFFEIASSLPSDKRSFTATDDAANMLIEAVARYKTRSGMASYLRRESQGWATYSDHVLNDLLDLVNDIRSMPTGYFEAKPQRAVGFDEIATAIIPDSASNDLRICLDKAGVKYVEYEAGNEQDRLAKLNSLEDVRFSREDTTMEVPYGQEGTDEDDASFIGRMHESARRSKKVGEVVYGYTPSRVLYASNTAEETWRELKRLGIKSFLHDGLEYNYNGKTYKDPGVSGALNDGTVAIYVKAFGDGIEYAGHEAFHVWKNTPARGVYADIVKANINITTSVYGLQQADQVLNDYFGGNIDAIIGAENEANRIAFSEELYARISGQIHSGAHEAELRTMFRDYDMVKAAWDELVYSQTDGKQSTRYSREMPTVAELQRENRLLKERLEYWKGQTKTTGKKTVRVADVDKVAQSILDEYESAAEFAPVRNAMKYLADDMLNGKIDSLGAVVAGEDSLEDALWDRARERALEIARNIVGNAQRMTNEDLVDAGIELRKRLRNTPISLGSQKADIADFNDFRKRNFGNFLISDKGIPMESLWQDLQDEFGEGMFPDSIKNPADQILHLEEVMNSAKPEYDNPYRENLSQNVESCANTILDQLFSGAVRQTAPTFADRQAKKLEQMDAALEKSRKRVKDLIRERDAAVQEVKDKNSKKTDSRKRTQIRREIYSYKAKFDKMLTAPAKGNTLHAPVAMTRALAEFCEIFSDSEQRRLSGASMELEHRRAKAVTSQELSTVERKELANARAKAKIDNLERQYAKLQNDPALNIFYREDVKTLISGLRESLAEKNLYEMSRAELNDVLNVMKGMHNAIVNANKVFTAGKDKTLLGMVRKMSAEMDQVNVNANGIAVAGRRYMMWQMSPDTFFDYICGYIKNNEGQVVQKMFSGGTERMLTVQRAFNERFDHITNTQNAEEAKQLRAMTRNPTKNMVDWGLKNAQGDRVLTSRGMMIQAYMLLKQEDSFDSIIWGGLKLPNAKEYYKGNISSAYGDAPLGQILSESMTEQYNSLDSEAKALREELKAGGLNTAEAEKAKAELQALEEKMAEMTAGAKARWISLRDGIEKMLTPFEKDMIQTTAEWFTYSGELMCEAHEQQHGYRPNVVKDYVPIHRDPSSIVLDIRAEDPGKAFNLENSGFLKERVKSRAPILLTDFFEELNRQSVQISRYYGFAQVQADFNRLWNARIPGTTTTLKAKVGAKFGEGRTKSIFGVSGEKYVMNYIADIAGAKHEEGLFDRLYSAGASANLSGNLRVAVSQLASIPTASAEIGWKSVAKGFARGVQTGFSTKQKIALGQKNVWFYQRYRGAGGITEIADLKARGDVWEKVASSRVGKLLFNWCQSFDAFATATMWSMAEDYVKAQGTKAEDAGYQEAVNQAYTDIIRKTQPNYTATERSDFLRDKRAGMKMFNMYKTQSNQNLNILLDANGRYIRAKRDLKNGKNGITQADVKAAGARLANAYTSVIIGGTMSFVLLRTAVNFLMGMVNPYRDDDDDEVTVGQTAKAMGSEMLSSLFGMFGLGGTLYDIVSAVVNREKFWGLTDSAVSSVSDLLTNAVNTVQMFTDPEKEFKWSQIEKDIGSFLSVIGAPYNNVKKFVTAAQMWYNDLKNGTFGQYTRAQTTTNQYRARLLEAYLDGDEEKRDDVLAYLMIEADAANDFEAEKDVQSGFCTFLKGKFTAGEVTEEDARGVMAYLGMEPDEIQEKLDQWRGIVDTDRTYTQEKDAYLEEEVSTDEFIAYLTQYMGRSEEEAAEEELRLRCQRDEGIVYGSIEEMMASGYLDEERGRELLAKYGGDSSAKDYFNAIMAGDTRSATAIRQNMKQELLADGYLTYEADSSIQSGFTTQVKNEYLDGKLDKSRAAALIRQYGGKQDPQTEIKKWDFQMDYGYSWGARARAYRTGSISKEALIRAVMDIEGETREDAEEYIRFLDLQKKNQDVEITASDASGYFEHAEPVGIKLETYLQFKETVSGLESDRDENGKTISGSKKEKVLNAIDALPLTIAQKDALYYAQGYKESTLDEAPWHKRG